MDKPLALKKTKTKNTELALLASLVGDGRGCNSSTQAAEDGIKTSSQKTRQKENRHFKCYQQEKTHITTEF